MNFYRSAKPIRLLLTVILLLPMSVHAQVLVLREAEGHMTEGRYEEAIAALQYLKDNQANFVNLDYLVGVCKLLTWENRDKSVDEFMNQFADFQTDRYFHYWNGKINLRHQRFAPAIESFEKFLSSEKLTSFEFDRARDDAAGLLEELNSINSYVIGAYESPVNTFYNELNPVLKEGGQAILFVSDRREQGTFQVFCSEASSYGWNTPRQVTTLSGGMLASSNDNTSITHFDPTTGTLTYIENISNTWTETRKETISTLTGAQSVYINTYKNRIIFSTKVPNGKTDLFEIVKLRSTNEWMTPTALSGMVNSEADEDHPFLSEDRKRLYLSSNRKGGLGGMDVYVCTFDEASLSWSKPVNLGLPINSFDDDVCFRMDVNNLEGSFSSNRVGSKGDFDSYFFRSENVISMK